MLLSEVYDIKIHNLLGKEIKNFQVMNASQEININMADLATGVYLIELVNSKKEKNTIRVVKQ
ncbi:MAG: T9SS type A sorting domain-containing protein [Raineya sp.]|nr:T9SS type A sorting domain-containing protein [Raineya sp.]